MNKHEYIKKITSKTSKEKKLMNNFDLYNMRQKNSSAKNAKKSFREKQLNEYLNKLEKIILEKYHRYIINSMNLFECKMNKNIQETKVYSINLYSLLDANNDIKLNIQSFLNKRKNMIGNIEIKPGFIAGIIIYNLSRYHIIHLDDDCLNCEYKCFQFLSEELSIRCGLEYIGIHYLHIPQDLRRELIYLIRKENINQESLSFMCLMLEYLN